MAGPYGIAIAGEAWGFTNRAAKHSVCSMFGSFRVARIFGIAIEINLSWVLIIAILGWTLSEDLFPSWYDGWSRGAYWAVGIIAALLLFVTVLVHELTH